jgi:hypothetical protein
MKKLMKKLEDIMVAITFAEAGEYDEAQRESDAAESQQGVNASPGFKKTALESPGK